VKGDAYSRGLQLGSKAKELIAENVRYYLYLWSTYSGMDSDAVIRLAKKFIPHIEKYDTDLLEEMKGIAEGSKSKLEEIIALNCRYEFVWTEMQYASDPHARVECTAVGATPEATENLHTIMGQNWDYKPKVKKSCIILEEIQEPNKPNIVMHTEAGIIGQKGLNSAGIGLNVNALTSAEDKLEPKVPFWVMVRGVLDQRTLDQSMFAATSASRAASGNLLLGHKNGEIIDLELTPSDFGFMFPVDGLLSHANNFVDLRHTCKVVDKIKRVEPGSLIRTERARRLIQSQGNKTSVHAIEEMLKDHFNYPNSICCHPDPNYKVDYQSETLASIIFDLNEKSVTLAVGPPCSNKYETLRFNSLTQSN
jgi:isopenicillin-N N-acyltransferase-like protein